MLSVVLHIFLVVYMMGHGFEHWTGDRPIGELERLVYERNQRDLDDTDRRDLAGEPGGIWFDAKAANHAVVFFSKYLKLHEGEWGGKTFVLSPWEKFCTECLFGWKILPDVMTQEQARAIPFAHGARLKAGIIRRFMRGYIEVPRKSGKSPWAAGIALYLLQADGEPGAQVYSAATKADQAKIVWKIAKRMLQMNKQLCRRTEMLTSCITYRHPSIGENVFLPLSKDGKTMDGLNVHGAVIDELHAHKSRTVWDVIASAQGSRRQPLVMAITTAGEGETGICREQRSYCEKILREVMDNDRVFAFIACADKDDDWSLEHTWRKANPNYGISVKPSFLKNEAKEAAGKPAYLNTFKRYYLNLWVNAADCWMNMDSWKKCGDEFSFEDMRGRSCIVGFDLSRRKDLTSMQVVFWPTKDDPFTRSKSHFWVPQDTIVRRSLEDGCDYNVWQDMGLLTGTQGAVVDYDYPEKALEDAAKMFDIKHVGFDPWNATKFFTDMEKKGWKNMVEIRQGFATLSPGMKELENLILQGKYKHDNNKVMTWCMSNCVAKTDENENICPSKKKSTNRIDGVSALLTAMPLLPVQKPKSKYESEELTII